ncbi:hypothetical protein M8C21_031224 [Ambrosia artemisiifolia]|uniref:Uncharacterized protein n=1 Tax=Ambrosia artemisiifolia TaxID=4212 RepID=A0AAD5BKR0_AMBAR|nr:hypothetical protein M8C21_031224 [Ambrosia artemisiifolia]
MEESVNLRTSFHHQGSNAEATTQAFAVTEEPKSENQHIHEDGVPVAEETVNSNILDGGSLEYGCSHYRRRCRIRAPCCDEIFNCRHCHNEAKNDINVNQEERHTIPRHEVICTLCGTEQEVRQMCVNCGVCMGKYFCGACKLFDDDISKRQYHCDGCGICRIGGQENFFHCDKCRCCYSNVLKDCHPCVEGAMHHDCPVCFEVCIFTLRTCYLPVAEPDFFNWRVTV